MFETETDLDDRSNCKPAKNSTEAEVINFLSLQSADGFIRGEGCGSMAFRASSREDLARFTVYLLSFLEIFRKNGTFST